MIMVVSKRIDNALQSGQRRVAILHNVHWALRGECKANQFGAIRVASAQKG